MFCTTSAAPPAEPPAPRKRIAGPGASLKAASKQRAGAHAAAPPPKGTVTVTVEGVAAALPKLKAADEKGSDAISASVAAAAARVRGELDAEKPEKGIYWLRELQINKMDIQPETMRQQVAGQTVCRRSHQNPMTAMWTTLLDVEVNWVHYLHRLQVAGQTVWLQMPNTSMGTNDFKFGYGLRHHRAAAATAAAAAAAAAAPQTALQPLLRELCGAAVARGLTLFWPATAARRPAEVPEGVGPDVDHLRDVALDGDDAG